MRIVGRFERFGPARHAVEEIELLAELRVELAVGDVATCGNVDVLQPDAVGQHHAQMPCLPVRLPVEAVVRDDRYLRDRRDAVVHALAVDYDVAIAQPPERIDREILVDDLGFLKAQDIGLGLAQELLDDTDPEADRIDVPTDDLHGG